MKFPLASIALYFLLFAAHTAISSAYSPEPRQQNFDWMPLSSWYQMHAEDVHEAYKGEAKLVFMGDSITQAWDWALWKKHFSGYKAVNFGIGGDKTQNVLWRLQNGNAGRLKPQLVVLMVGVNNFGHDNDSADEVAKGIELIVDEINQRFPVAKILVLGILPYGEKAETENRERVIQTNSLLVEMSHKKNFVFRDYGNLFIQEDGDIPRELMGDLLHPSVKGYALLAHKLSPLIKELMASSSFVSATNKNILIEGRSNTNSTNQLEIGYPGVSLHFDYEGKKLDLLATSSHGKNLVDVYLDGELIKTLEISQNLKAYSLLDDPYNEKTKGTHHIELVHRSETWHGVLTVDGLNIHDGKLRKPKALPKRKLLFIGDSITCGEALIREKECKKNFNWWDPENAFGKLLAEKLNAQSHLVCYGGRGLVRSWNGNTEDQQAPDFFNASLALGANSPQWDHLSYIPDLVFISLGTNDFSLDIGPFPEENAYVSTYLKFIQDIQKIHPKTAIVLSEGPIVNNGDPQRPQKTVLQNYLLKVQQKSKGKVFYLPSAVYNGDDCDAHPTAEQHAKLAADLSPELKKIMAW